MSLENLARYLKGLYPLGVMLAVAPLVDLVIRMFPFNVGDITWRFGASIVVLGNSAIMLTGLALIGAVAAMSGHAVVLRIVSVVAALGFLLMLGLLGVYVLDGTQIRAATPPQGQTNAFRGILSGISTAVFSLPALAGLSLAAWRTGGAMAAREARAHVRRPDTVVKPSATAV